MSTFGGKADIIQAFGHLIHIGLALQLVVALEKAKYDRPYFAERKLDIKIPTSHNWSLWLRLMSAFGP